jgi:hypothetical protein
VWVSHLLRVILERHSSTNLKAKKKENEGRTPPNSGGSCRSRRWKPRDRGSAPPRMSGARALLNSRWMGEASSSSKRHQTHGPRLAIPRLPISSCGPNAHPPPFNPLCISAEGSIHSRDPTPPMRGSEGSSSTDWTDVDATGTTSSAPRQLVPPSGEERDAATSGKLRRNSVTVPTALSELSLQSLSTDDPYVPPAETAGSPIRRNISCQTLNELRRQEQAAMEKADAALQGSRVAVVEAVACVLLEHILGMETAHAAMREAFATSPRGDDGSLQGISEGRRSSSDGVSSAAMAAAAQAAEDDRLLADVPKGISQSVCASRMPCQAVPPLSGGCP